MTNLREKPSTARANKCGTFNHCFKPHAEVVSPREYSFKYFKSLRQKRGSRKKNHPKNKDLQVESPHSKMFNASDGKADLASRHRAGGCIKEFFDGRGKLIDHD